MMSVDEAKKRFEVIDRRLGQLGIDVRVSGQHQRMHAYLALLQEEVRMTADFLQEETPRPGREVIKLPVDCGLDVPWR